MRLQVLAGTVAVAGLAWFPVAAVQLPGLNAGMVTAKINGEPFSANVSVAMLVEGKLVLSSLSNEVQIQVPDAKPGTFELNVAEDGNLIDIIVGLKVGEQYIAPVTGSLTIEALSVTAASGRFEFEGKDLRTDAPVKVTDGRF